jgi:hypothetical protein
MSKRTRALVLAAMVAAMNLAAMTTVALAQANDEPTRSHTGRRPPTAAQVGEPYRYYHDALAAQAQTAQDDAVERFRQGERASQQQPTTADSRRPPTEAQVGESWRHPGNVRARPAESSGQPGWLVLGLGALVAALALAGGLAVTTTRRTRRRVRAGQAA